MGCGEKKTDCKLRTKGIERGEGMSRQNKRNLLRGEPLWRSIVSREKRREKRRQGRKAGRQWQ